MRVQIIFIFVFFILADSVWAQVGAMPEDKRKAAVELVSKAEAFKNSGDLNQAVMLYNQAANTYLNYGLQQQAIDLFELALKYNQQRGNTTGVIVLLNQLGMLAYDQNRPADAAVYFSKGIDLARNTTRKAEVVGMMVSLANVHLDLNKNNEALNSISEATTIASSLYDLRLLRSCYSVYSKVYDKLDNRKKSTEYFELYSAITKKIQKDEVGQKEQEATKKVVLANLQVQQVVAEKKLTEKELLANQKSLEKAQEISKEMQLQIELLNKDRLLKESIIAQQLLMRRVYLAIIFASLLFTALIYYFYREKKKANKLLKQRNEEILLQKGEIEQQAKELVVINDQKTKLFSIIAHDLRSPLSSLITLMNVANAGIISDEDFKHAINDLSVNVTHTASLLENLLNWARCQMQRINVKMVVFELFEIVDDKVALVIEPAKNKGITVVNEVNANVEVYADTDMISLVVRNLVSNAVKFCRSGDRISISTSPLFDEIIVAVKDTGVGIAPEDIDKIFGDQIYTTRGTSNEMGTGLGLVLSKEFVELNGGRIWVESELDKGTTFFFTLKAKPENADGKSNAESIVGQEPSLS
ncbi:tetratricopeptide repeat-containing sensor histidine kinase [Williamwhitmania taraxaci]|uniref:histidine kinase n=1 Tax=Williamwhitmania taraxaci TaxID=1640674 RepID=A0A1G6GM84_9BACT|nr:ATP-binding protein [Williamwhitmania taraxaci]SDB83120.1 Signal transduction histidine kinase [Williamwhitmania taraxaci]